MQDILRRLTDLEKNYMSLAVYWSFAKFVAVFLFAYVVGGGYFLWKWYKAIEDKFTEYVDERSDGIIEQFGSERVRDSERINTIDQCNKEHAGAISMLLREIDHERILRKQQIDSCKERCEAVRCKNNED